MWPFNIREQRRKKDKVKSLVDFLANAKTPQNLPSEIAIKNLGEGLIEIISDDGKGKYLSNGLLISEDGYFITARHCVDFPPERQTCVKVNGVKFPLKKICAVSPAYDIALARIDLENGEKRARSYNLHLGNKFDNMPLVLMTKRNGKIETRHGTLATTSLISYSETGSDRLLSKGHIAINMPGVGPGDSGSVLISTQGEIMGFASCAIIDANLSFYAGLDQVLRLIYVYVQNKIK